MTRRTIGGVGLCATLALIGAACADPGTDSQRPSEGEFTLQVLVAAIATADTAAVYDLFWPEATYDDFANQLTYQGVQEIAGYVLGAHAWGDDVYMNLGVVHRTENGAVGEWVFTAVQSRPLGERYPVGTGREVVLNGVTIIEMDGGRIIRAADYTDTAPMMLQLGASFSMPGGQVIEMESGR